ncbi:MAG: filamentous hemagglutinin N-terminal domain-containing protein [Xenococcaceae cyanobacterium MO_167.B27]|nr:filamentous hemagglutinin N-terminal domain-containing protein [Xenococcaceae cyanobacterium MO_167.B27]
MQKSKICLFLFVFFLSQVGQKAQSQVIPDNTLGAESSVINSVNELRNIIEGGATRGSNLFHSFQEFQIGEGLEVYFANPDGISNIFSRVSGSNISEILGTLGVEGSANLFFINPNGIVFGENARLDVGGSFIATTADRVNFADGNTFSARSDEKPLLTWNAPIGLGLEGNNGSITINGQGHNLIDPIFAPLQQGSSNPNNGLQVPQNRLLGFIGNGIILNGGILTAEGGRIELGSVDSGTVSLGGNSNSADLVFDYSNITDFQDIELLSKSLVNTSGVGIGSVQATGANIKFSDGSIIWLQNQASQASQDITINASESLEIIGSTTTLSIRSGIYSETISGGRGADMKISTPQLLLSDGAIISTSASNIGDGGNIEINTQKLSVTRGANLATATIGQGNGGNLNIQSHEKVEIIGFSPLSPQLFSSIASNTGGSGQGGNLTIEAPSLLLQDRGTILTSVINSEGLGGNITLNISDITQLIGQTNSDPGTQTAISSATFGSGDAGSIILNTNQLIIQTNSTIDSSTFADGNAGELFINVTDSAIIDGSSVTSSADEPLPEVSRLIGLDTDLTGNAGKITFNSSKLEIVNGGEITVRNQGTGDGGSIQINADSINLSEAGSITASTFSGEGGSIILNSDRVSLENNSLISTDAGELSRGGDITINADRISLNQSDINARSDSGNGGNITLDADQIRIFNNSNISASALGGDGNGGNVTIFSDTFLAVNDSDVTARAVQGNGGNILIDANALLGIEEREAVPNNGTSDADASSEFGEDGTVTITNPQTNIQDPIAALQEPEIESVEPKFDNQCWGNAGNNPIVYTGRSGYPESPEHFDSQIYVPTPGFVPPEEEEEPSGWDFPVWKEGDPIINSNAVRIDENGDVYFVAEITSQTAEQLICKPQVTEADEIEEELKK